ncbi:MAG: ATP-binding protein [Candidatus Sericytochromatia bacterium]
MALLALMIVPPLWFWVVRPLRRMVAIADRLGHGDLATPVPIDRTDEFGELEKAFESLRQRVQQMLAARERLLRDISHELRAPLSRMAIAVPLLRDDRPSPYIDHLERDMTIMDDLIGEILALARGRSPESLQRGPVDLAEVAAGLLAERGVVLAQREMPVASALAPAPTVGDRRLLARAMGNLLDNALKYTPDQAAVRLETAIEHGEAVFRVADRGPGIRAADLPHLFEPFYRPDASRTRETGGTGLGLAIAGAIAEAHGGTATLRSSEGLGTTAELRFPVEAGTTTLGS